MAVFEVASRIEKSDAPPRPRRSRAGRRWYAVLRYLNGIGIVGGLFALSLVFVHSELLFILLPVGLSVVITAITSRPLLRDPRSLLLTTCLALVYFGGVTGWELLTHNPATHEIIVVTTTLAAAVIFEPLRAYLQRVLEQRFHLNDATTVAVAAFTSELREEIDLDQVRERFLDVLQKILRPQSASLWVRTTTRDAPGARDATGAPLDKSGSGARSLRAPDAQTDDDERQAPAAEPSDWLGPSQALVEVGVDDLDPLLAYVLAHPVALEVDRPRMASALLQSLQAHRVEIALPLASQGDLLGLLTLGPRMDGQEYAREDRALLDTLAAQVAPALRVVQLVQAQQAQVRRQERIEQELRTARDIQHTFLPRDVPALPGWQLVPYYQPAHEVGGDFYDFLTFEDGRIGLVIGDVTDKGIPAALVMTATRTMLRTAAQEDASPARVLARVNELLCADIPAGMFVTCFYALLDPANGQVRYANAGHEPPYRQRDGSAAELWATGMPLGLMPGTRYEEFEDSLALGESLLFYSDGLVEAHSAEQEMFGFPRLKALLAQQHDASWNAGRTAESAQSTEDIGDGTALIGVVLRALRGFTGDGWEQEDDVTLVALRRLPAAPPA